MAQIISPSAAQVKVAELMEHAQDLKQEMDDRAGREYIEGERPWVFLARELENTYKEALIYATISNQPRIFGY